MGAVCGTCGTPILNGNAVCSACRAPLAPAPVHLAPDAGLQTYADPYPPIHAGHAARRAYLPGRQVVTVTSQRGEWVQVAVDGADAGWVDGRRLVPPAINAAASVNGAIAYVPGAAQPARSAPAVTVDLFLGVLASVGIVLGAVLSWTRGASSNAFSIPVEFLFDPESTARNPRLGWVLVVFAILGLVVTFMHAAPQWRVLLGALATGATVAYMGQVAAALPQGVDFTDAIGPGVWVTLISGVGLMISAAFVPHETLPR